MKKLLFATPGQADVILTKPLARLVVFSSSHRSSAKPVGFRSQATKLDTFFTVRSDDAVRSREKVEVSVDEHHPHFRQRVAFMAGLITDLEHANWPAISSTWDNLRRETKGTPLEKSIEMLREPIRRKHAHALAQAIDALLRNN